MWFHEVKEEAPNAFIHWDSAHEALARIDLMKSLDLAAPYLGQFHLCDAIVDPKEPCFGDLHMDVARAPEWKTEGFFNTGGWSRNFKEGSIVRLPCRNGAGVCSGGSAWTSGR
ncbi:MAG: hypothetical protein V8S96_02110 [Lachnospiraceae bacterium]